MKKDYKQMAKDINEMLQFQKSINTQLQFFSTSLVDALRHKQCIDSLTIGFENMTQKFITKWKKGNKE